jgi:hypothetical protein
MSFKDRITTILLLGQDSIPASVLPLRASKITLDPLQAPPSPPPHGGSELRAKFKA